MDPTRRSISGIIAHSMFLADPSRIRAVGNMPPDNTGASGESVLVFNNLEAARTAELGSLSSDCTLVILNYKYAGDLGGAQYVRAKEQVARPGQFQSKDGKWWGIAVPILHAEMFGAIGDGHADDTDAIHEALSVGDVVLLARTYNVRGIVVPNGRALRGQGRGQTIVRAADRSVNPTLSIDSTSQSCRISQLTISGNKGNQTRPVHGFAFNSVGFPANGRACPGASHAINDLEALECSGDGFHIADARGVSAFNHLFSYRCDGRGCFVNIQDSQFSDCDFGDNGLHGLELGESCYNNRFSSIKTWFSGQLDKNLSGDGIHCKGWHNLIIGFECQDSGRHGVVLQSASYNTLIGRIESPGSVNSPGVGILLSDSRSNSCELQIVERDVQPSMRHGARLCVGGSGVRFNALRLNVARSVEDPVLFEDLEHQSAQNDITLQNNINDDGWIDLSRRVHRARQVLCGGLEIAPIRGATGLSLGASEPETATIGFDGANIHFFSAAHAMRRGGIDVVFDDGSEHGGFRLCNSDGARLQDVLVASSKLGRPMLGFFGADPATRPTVVGKRRTEEAMRSLLDALSSLGLIHDATT